jgi:hypothetical protein
MSVFFLLAGCAKEQEAVSIAAPQVRVADVIQQDIPIYQECLSSTDTPDRIVRSTEYSSDQLDVGRAISSAIVCRRPHQEWISFGVGTTR